MLLSIMYPTSATILLSLLNAVIALDPSCAPGRNFDLTKWTLELPFGTADHPTSIQPSDLKGCKGYEDSGHDYFFTKSGDGALVMKVPGSPDSTDCVTTANSKHCRTELRESIPSSWDPKASTNRLKVQLSVPIPDDSGYGIVIGQIHIDNSVSVRPVCELFYNKKGEISMGVEKTREGGNEQNSGVLAHVAVGSEFTYEIRYEGGKLSVGVNAGAFKTLSTYDLDAPKSYFKVGNYNQGEAASDVHFFAISAQH